MFDCRGYLYVVLSSLLPLSEHLAEVGAASVMELVSHGSRTHFRTECMLKLFRLAAAEMIPV